MCVFPVTAIRRMILVELLDDSEGLGRGVDLEDKVVFSIYI